MRTFYFALIILAGYHALPGKIFTPNTGNKMTTERPVNVPSLADPIKAVKIDASKIPKSISYLGKMREAWQWTDNLGDNILIMSKVGDHKATKDPEMLTSGAELHAYHFVKKDAEYKLLWQMNDAVTDCGFDIICDFLKNSTTITDLDSNGIAETKVQYQYSCRSDVSPDFMKLIMHQDTVKYALRGLRWMDYTKQTKFSVTENNANLEKLPKKKDEYEQFLQREGRYESEKDFGKAPPVFLRYARSQWIKYAPEGQ